MPRKNLGKKLDVNGTLQDLGNTLSDEDLEKLDGIEEGAQKNVQSDWSATSGDSFIKNKPTNLATTDTSQTLYKKSFNQVTINVGTSSTSSSTAIKVVTLSNFELKTGAIIDVKFSNGSYYDTGSTTGLELSLNVNSTGAKKIINYISSGATNNYHSKNNYRKWNAGDTVRFRYDGTYWNLVANLTTMTSYLAPVFRFPLRYNKSDGSSTYWYGTENLDLTHLLPSAVQYVSQTLTDAQKTQARTNIGAGTSNFSGNYNDLSNKPTLFSGNYNDLSNKPSLFSGNYNDLTNKPTIPDASSFQTKGTVDITNTTPSSATKYYPIYSTGTGTGQTARANNELYYYDSGTWSSLNIGSMGNKGILTLHFGTSSADRYVDISPASALTANRTLTIPDASGTIALTNGTVATATNATKLNNQEPSYYLNYNNLSNKPTIPDVSKYLPLTGGTLTGHLYGQYLSGTWLQTTSTTDLGSTPTQIAVLSNGWVYYRTLAEMKTDLGLGTQATFSLSGTTLTITPK